MVAECSGKVGYTSRAVAEKVIRRQLRQGKARKRGTDPGRLHVYVCPHCRQLHVGHG